MKGARAHLHVVGLQDHAALIGPEALQRENEALEGFFRAHVRGDGIGHVGHDLWILGRMYGDGARGTVSAGGPGIKAMPRRYRRRNLNRALTMPKAARAAAFDR